MNLLIALLGVILSFSLFLDNIDLLLDRSIRKSYKIIRTFIICFNIFAMLRFYMIS